jgi:hypothetical protein
MTAGLSARPQELFVASTMPASGEGQKLIAGSPEFTLNVAGQIAGCRRGQDRVLTSPQGAALAGRVARVPTPSAMAKARCSHS